MCRRFVRLTMRSRVGKSGVMLRDVVKLTDEELLEQLKISSTPGAIDYELCERELNRRYLLRVESAVKKLDTSSHRLESLTWALVGLTVVLAILAIPPAWEAATRLLGH